jgi:VIT1/CCC1 family predicted Fe2+/Mn2+ transporter
MVGLHSGTHSKLVVIGGIVTIAVADAFSDALGIHVSQESENQHSTREIWESTLATFIAKFLFALTFLIPILVLPITSAIVASVGWGLLLLGLFSYYMAREQEVRPWPVIAEHLVIALVVITISHYVGHWVEATFSSM